MKKLISQMQRVKWWLPEFGKGRRKVGKKSCLMGTAIQLDRKNTFQCFIAQQCEYR